MNSKFITKTMAPLLLIGSLSACAPTISSSSYESSQVGQVSHIEKGVIVGSRVVDIAGSRWGGNEDGGIVGTIVGGTAGAVAGSAIGHGKVSTLGAIGGAVAGGMLGNKAEKALSKQQGREYLVKTENGKTVAIAQGMEPMLHKGQHVFIEYGKRSRVYLDPDYAM